MVFDLRNTRVRNIARNALVNENRCYSTGIDQFVFLPATATLESVINSSKIRVKIDESHPVTKKDECGYYFSNGTALVCFKNSKRVLIRRRVEIIARKSFAERQNLTSVTIPASVIEVSENAFENCRSLQNLFFSLGSRLKVINSRAFMNCKSIKIIKFPKSLHEIRLKAFQNCIKLKEVIFPNDSQLSYISSALALTKIKHLSLPPSVIFLDRITNKMYKLETIYIKSAKYESNEEQTAVFSKDKSELFCFIQGEKIPDGVRIIKKGCFLNEIENNYLFVPSSVEVIEDGTFAFCNSFETIEFAQGSKLKDIGLSALGGSSRDLIINNKNFIKRDDGVVISLNPPGIVFVPQHLTEFEFEEGIEIIYSCAFYRSGIKTIKFPRSLKKICKSAFESAELLSVIFEERTELDFLGSYAFADTRITCIKLPPIKGSIGRYAFSYMIECIELPQNFKPSIVDRSFGDPSQIRKLKCPRSSISCVNLSDSMQVSFDIIEDS